MNTAGIVLLVIAGLGFASAGIYILQHRREFSTITGKLLAGIAAAGLFASLVNMGTTVSSSPTSALVVGAVVIVLLAFVPVCLLLAGHLHNTQIWLGSLSLLGLFILGRLLYPYGNGASLAGILGVALLILCLFQVYPFQQQEKSKESRNRFAYLYFAWILFLISDLFLINGRTELSLLGMAAGSWIAVILTTATYLPDFRYFPLQRYNPNQVLREFSLGISNITSPDLLATVSIGLISEALEINRGFLFSVDHESTSAGDAYRLQCVGGMGQIPDELQAITFQVANPPVKYFTKTRQPIRSKDLSGLPEDGSNAKTETQWFMSLDMEVFAPVHTKEQWIGLICLGPKTSGADYKEKDLAMIATLADQLSLAWQNARLIDSLMRVNNDFRRAYAAMEQSNRQLRQAVNQLEKIDKTKSDFISVASHELRTPLTLIRGYTEILLDEKNIRENEFQAKTVTGIHNGIMRLQEILESMLDAASIDSRTYSLSKQPVSIGKLINTIHNKLKPVLEERKLNLTVENLSYLPAIEADGVALNKVFLNVITNAIKYTPDGGSITINGVLISPDQFGLLLGGVEIIIADTGIGIEKENLELIFNKFFQTGQISLHSSGKTKYRGSGPGLGLAIAKGIVEAHGGRIWAESKGFNEDTFPGSQFHIILPLPKIDQPSD